MNFRVAIFGIVLTGLFAVAIATWTHGGTPTVPQRLVSGQPYGIVLDDGRATVDLYLEPDRAVRLLASNLGSSSRNATLRARAATLSGRPQYLPVACRRRMDNPARLHLESIDSNKTDRIVRLNSKPRPAATSPPPPTRDFWLHVTEVPLENPKGYQLIHGRLASSRETVEVYTDSSLGLSAAASANQELADEIAERLARDVVPRIHEHVGPIADPDKNGRLTVLLTPWLGRLRGGTTQVRGFVRSSDLRTDIAAPFSNHAELVYLNSDLPRGEALQSLLLHEVAHIALASRQHGVTDWDDWLNEGLAHLAERHQSNDWSNVDYRVARYWQHPAAASLVVRDYYRTGRWRNHGCRGATFLFLDWCQQQARAHGVTDLIPALMATGKSDVEALERVCRVPFADLYREWTLSLVAEPLSKQQPKIGRFLNSGPRFQTWDVDAKATREFDVAGSATQFTELRASQPGWYRLQFEGDPLDDWQLTVVPGTQPSPEISLQSRWEGEAPAEPQALFGPRQKLAVRREPHPPVTSKDPSRDSLPRLMVETRNQLPAGWQFDEIACELIQEPHPRVWNWPAASLTVSGSRAFAVPLPGEAVEGPEAIIKVRFKNSAGKVAWGWADVPAPIPTLRIQVSRRP